MDQAWAWFEWEVRVKTIITSVVTRKGNGFEIPLPAKRIVCPRCDGNGTHDHPAFSNGVDSEHLEDPDFSESYFRGHYDVRCEECHGERILDVLDYDALTPKMLDRVDRAEKQAARYQAEADAERRWGA